MNNLLRSAVRKHALANNIATSKWDDEQLAAYASEHGITERDNLKPVETIEKVEKVQTAGGVEQAIADLVAGLGIKAEAELDEQRVIELIAKYSNAPRLTTVEIKHEEREQVVLRENVHKDYPIVMAHIAAGVNVALVGPAGSFKSTTLKQVAEDLEKDYYIVSSPQTRSEIVGYNDGNGKYNRTPMRDAYEFGGLIVVEEFDGANPKALLAANNLVANEDTDFPDGMVKRHPNFVCVMAGNTFGTGASRQYVGRTQIDAATLDRFAFIEYGYDEALERKVARTEFDHDSVDAWVSDVQVFRAKVEKAGIRHVVSPRASIMGARLLKQGLPRDVITKTVLHKGLSADQIAQLAK